MLVKIKEQRGNFSFVYLEYIGCLFVMSKELFVRGVGGVLHSWIIYISNGVKESMLDELKQETQAMAYDFCKSIKWSYTDIQSLWDDLNIPEDHTL